MERLYSDEYKKLGLNIAYYRKERGLSQIQLAEAVGISRTHISRVENNDCAVSLDVIFSAARALQIPVFRLFEFRE
jgi:transcriptional regulator with XRE-family HTH domain